MSAADHPVRGFEGHVYVVRFESGVVKVGLTGNPKNRLAAYARDGAIHGNAVTDTWISPVHAGFRDNEKALLRFCADGGSLASGGEKGEYFVGVTFEDVRAHAEGLGFDRLDVDVRRSEHAVVVPLKPKTQRHVDMARTIERSIICACVEVTETLTCSEIREIARIAIEELREHGALQPPATATG